MTPTTAASARPAPAVGRVSACDPLPNGMKVL